MQPGQLIIPHGPDDPKPNDGPPEPRRPVEQPAPTGAASTALPETEQPIVHQVGAAAIAADDAQPESNWQYQQPGVDEPQRAQPDQDGLQWTASEFIAHDKNAMWYGALVAVSLVLAVVVLLLTKDKISTVIVVLVAILFGVFAGRKPNTLLYSLSDSGLQIGPKFYGFQDFKAFSVGQDGAVANVVLLPLKRFMPPLTIYVTLEMADSVTDFIGDFLPFEQHKTDAIDGLLRRIRF